VDILVLLRPEKIQTTPACSVGLPRIPTAAIYNRYKLPGRILDRSRTAA
jgi:hypothetical protein